MKKYEAVLNEAFEELFKLIKQALEKFENNFDELSIALIGGAATNEFFKDGLDKYCNDNIKKIKNIQIKFFIPNTSIQKASAIYAIKLNQENNYINILNRFTYLEELDFSDIDSETLFKIIFCILFSLPVAYLTLSKLLFLPT